MPNRYVREAAIKSKAVNSLSWQGEVFWRRLINLVDDFGRFHADPELLRADVFPRQLDRVRDSDIPRLLAECEKAGLLFCFEADAKPFLVMNQWEQGRALKSNYPAPPPTICEQMKTSVYIPKQMPPTTTTTTTHPTVPTPTPSQSKGLTSKHSLEGGPGETAPGEVQGPKSKVQSHGEWTPFRVPTAREAELLALGEAVLNGQWADNSQFWGNRIMGSDQIKAAPNKVERVLLAVREAEKNGEIKTTKAQCAMHFWKTFV